MLERITCCFLSVPRWAALAVTTLLMADTGWVSRAHAAPDARASSCIVSITTDISGTTTWDAGCVYIVENPVSFSGGTLTIQKGAIIKFMPNTSLTIAGTLRALGTEADSVVFTSYLDDNYGGDTNGDGAVTQPAAGDWVGLIFAGTAANASAIDYNVVRFAGSSSGAIECAGSSPVIRRTHVAESSSAGIYVENGSPQLLGNVVESCGGAGMVMSGTTSPKFFSTFYPTLANVLAGNTVDAIQHVGGAVSSSTWRVSGYPWHVAAPVHVSSNGSTLTMEAGLVVKMAPGAYLEGDDFGHLKLVGTEVDSIVITSIADDSAGGDSNGDGSTTTPAPGDWHNIRLTRTDLSLLEYCSIRFGGGDDQGMVRFGEGSLSSVRRCSISRSSSAGIHISDSSPKIIGDTIIHCAGAAVALTGTSSPHFFSGSYPGLSNVFASNGFDVVTHAGGTIGGSNWKVSGYPWHVLGPITLQSNGSTLALEPGLIVKMAPGAYFEAATTGHLQFAGTEADSIIITSIADDGYGGDSNNDGGTTLPAPGDWYNIRATETDLSLLEYCHIRFAGQGGTAAVVFSNGGNSTIRRCLVTQNSNDAIVVAISSPTILGNTITGNAGAAVAVSGTSSPHFFSGAYPGLSNFFVGNGTNAVIHSGGTIGGCQWEVSGYPWHVLGPITIQNNGSTLTLQPGLIVKMAPGTYFEANDYAHFQFVGTETDSIVITSVYDDGYGGDSNNDGDGTQAAPGDWDAIRVLRTDLSLIQYCSVHCAGGGASGAVVFSDASMSALRNSLVGRSATSAVHVVASTPTIEDNVIDDSSASGIHCGTGSYPLIHFNSFLGDSTWFGILADDASNPASTKINATDNWWNDNRGPFDPSPADGLHNPTSAGARVTDAVNYDPFVSNEQPVLNLGQSAVDMTMLPGKTGSQLLLIKNDGDAALSFSITESNPSAIHDTLAELDRSSSQLADVPWLTVTPTEGNLAPGEARTLDIAFDSDGLSPGTYNAQLEFSSNDPDHASEVVPVALHVSNVIVLHPTAGIEVSQGTTFEIAWQHYQDGLDSTSVDLSLDGGGTYPWSLARGLPPRIESFSWHVSEPLSPSCRIRVTAHYSGGVTVSAESDGSFSIIDGAPATGIGDDRPPRDPELSQNFPNPFNPTTTISFSLPSPDEVNVTIYDTRGRRITTLFDGLVPGGRHTLQWTGTDEHGVDVSSGVYLYRLRTPTTTISRKMILLK